MNPRFLGLDLAWSERNPSGLAALDAGGRLIDVRADLRADAEILGWVRAHIGSCGVIGIDMPTIVRNPTGMRRCERELAAVFRAAHAGLHPANLRRFPDGGRARRLIDGLCDAGVVEALDVRAHDPRIVALEIFPHPAHVRLFALDRIFSYKKKARAWPAVLAEWSRYRTALATLAAADPPLLLDASVPPEVTARGYKYWDDTLDAISCAYVASFVWRWGIEPPHVRVFGNLEEGYIVVPDRVWKAREQGTTHRVTPTKNPSSTPKNGSNSTQPFLTDVKELRRRARAHLETGNITETYGGDVDAAIEILQNVLATEIVCVLRYTMHAVAATGIASEAVKDEFAEHAKEEQEHMMMVAERINQLGGKPNFNPEGLASRSASQYAEGENLVDMIKENYIAERIAVDHYRELVRYFADNDPTTRVMLEGILATEEEHTNDMHDLLVAHEGKPMLPAD